jgi:glutaredoxin
MKVKLFTVAGCKSCLLVKVYLLNRGVDLEVIDADADLETALKSMKRAGTEQLPLVEYKLEEDDYNYIVGYDEDNLAKLTKLCLKD